MASTPHLAMMPLSRAEAGAGAAGCAEGSQLWRGYSPALAPKPTIAQNTAANTRGVSWPGSSDPPFTKASVAQCCCSTAMPNRARNAPPTE